MVDPDPPYYWLPGGQDKPAISAGANSFFAVWEDGRTGINHIYGTRISKDGVVLDTCGLLISNDYSLQANPIIAFGYYSGLENNYLCVWIDKRTPQGLYGTRLSGNEVIDTQGISIETFENVDNPSLAYASVASKYIVVWNTYDGDIKGRTVDINGNVSGRFSICTETGTQSCPKVSFNGTNFLVVWQDNRSGNFEAYGARVTPNGNVLDPGGKRLVNPAGTVSGGPDVASCGGYWLCVWIDARDGNYNIYGTRMDNNGNVLDAPSILISESTFYDEMEPAVSSSGDTFIVTYVENYWDKDIVNALVQTDGTVISYHYSSNSMVIYRRYADVAFCDNVFFSVWSHCEPYRSGIVGSRIDTDGNFIDDWVGINVGTTATIQSKPVCAFGGDSALILWEDNFDGIVGEMVNLNGTPLKKFNIAFLNRQPAIAYTYSYYLCVWHGHEIDSTIKAQRITRNGAAIPETINIVDSISWTPSLDVDGGAGTFCVGWIDLDYPRGVYCSNLDTGGVIVQPSIDISNNPTADFQSLSACFNDSNYNYLIAWHESDIMMYDSIICRMISRTGGLLSDRVPLGEGTSPSLTFDGTNYFCVWQQWLNLVGRWITVDWEPGDTCLIPFYIRNPKLSFCGDGYIITGERDGKVLGVKLSLTGSIIDSFEVGDGKQPSVAAIKDKYFLTWSSFTPYPYSSYRIWGEFGSFIGVEESNVETPIHRTSLQVSPNPFTHTTAIRVRGSCSSPHDTPPRITIHDSAGRLVKSLDLGFGNLDFHEVVWDGRAQNGKIVRPGIYFIKANGYKTVKVAKLR